MSERRRAPRMAVNGLAYVNLDPDNGGIILNISEGGLCFQSTAPVQRTDTIRFWFSYRSRRNDSDPSDWKDEPQTRGISRFIEAGSELAWTDESKKVGGLRFTSLPPGAREQIREWMHQPTLVNVNGKAVPLFPLAKRFPSAVLVETSAKLQALFRKIQSANLWTGFSGGLATGVIVSALVVAAVLLVSHSRQLGDSLVQLGERLGGRSWSQQKTPVPQPAPAEAFASLSVPPSIMSEAKALEEKPKPPATVVPPSRLVKPPSTTQPTPAKPHPEEPVAASSGPLPALTPKPIAPALKLDAPTVKPVGAPSVNPSASRPSLSENVLAPAPDSGVNVPRASAPEIEFVSRAVPRIAPAGVGSIGMRSEKFLEVGKFKEKLLADKATGQLAQRGFPAIVAQRTRFLGKSYQVLVGPYATDTEAEAVHKDLASLGFTPRSYERGKRDFNLPPGMKVGATHLPDGYCVISWESYIPDAIVKMEDDYGRGVTVEGKWVRQGVKFPQNAIAYRRNKDGSRSLLEIRFAAMNQALVFGTPSN